MLLLYSNRDSLAPSSAIFAVVYIYVCTYMLYIYMYVCVCARARVRIVCIYVYVCIYMCIYVYVGWIFEGLYWHTAGMDPYSLNQV